jgi:hypothetical protein
VKRFLFRNGSRKWCVADSTGIAVGNTQILGDVCALDFNTAINLSREYADNADAAELAGDAEGVERWSDWSEQLEIWAAKLMPAPGRVLRNPQSELRNIVIRRHAIHDDSWPTFAEMTRCGGVR